MQSKFLKVILCLAIFASFSYGALKIYNFYYARKMMQQFEVRLQKYPNNIKTSEIALQCQKFLTSQHVHPAIMDAYPDIIALGNLDSCCCMIDVVARAGALEEVRETMKKGKAFNLALQSTSSSVQKLIEETCQ